MCSTSVFALTMTMIFEFTTICIFSVFILKGFLRMWEFISFRYDAYFLFVSGIIFFFSRWIIFISCSLKDSKNLLVQFHLWTHDTYFRYHQMSMLYTLSVRRKYVHLLFLLITFQDYFNIHLLWIHFNQRF